MTWSCERSTWKHIQKAQATMKELDCEPLSWSTIMSAEYGVSVFSIDLERASMGDFTCMRQGLFRFPVQHQAAAKFLDIAFAKDLSIYDAKLRSGQLMTSTWKALNDAAELSFTSRKHFVLHLFEVPDIDTHAIWLRHHKEELFLPFGPGLENTEGVSSEEFTGDIVRRATKQRRNLDYLFVAENDLPVPTGV